MVRRKKATKTRTRYVTRVKKTARRAKKAGVGRVAGSFAYGVMRPKLSQFAMQMLPMAGIGVYADELVMLGLTTVAAKQKGLIGSIARYGQAIEAYNIGLNVGAGLGFMGTAQSKPNYLII